jgi:hypothetical protein
MSRTTVDHRGSFVNLTYVNFEFAMSDVTEILHQYDACTQHRSGKPSRRAEVLKRAAVILSITAWESFIEDTFRACAEATIEKAGCPSDVQSLFNSVAHHWLEKPPKPPELADWTGNGWKALLKRRLETDILALNTPSSVNIRTLSKRYLNADITTRWRWAGTTPSRAAIRLDALIRLRGEVAHRGRDVFDRISPVDRKQVVQAISLVKHLAECTERALGRSNPPRNPRSTPVALTGAINWLALTRNKSKTDTATPRRRSTQPS